MATIRCTPGLTSAKAHVVGVDVGAAVAFPVHDVEVHGVAAAAPFIGLRGRRRGARQDAGLHHRCLQRVVSFRLQIITQPMPILTAQAAEAERSTVPVRFIDLCGRGISGLARMPGFQSQPLAHDVS